MNNFTAFPQQITFLHTNDLNLTQEFYVGILGLPLVRDQETCRIFQVNPHAFLGFCTHIEPISKGRRIILTLVSENVDRWFEVLKGKNVDIISPPEANPKFKIYHFFFKDPNGYWIEIQKFDEPLSTEPDENLA
jgi:catechol 2,3-dioxygenase-like lactoylglutathione lyase family enzyme